MNVLYIVGIVIAILAVAGVLLAGLINMARGGSSVKSQKLMRWRIALQAIALFVIMGVIWVLGG